jgi:hypothetical protein
VEGLGGVLASLIEFAGRSHGRSLSVFGSAVMRDWKQASDIDVHLVVETMTVDIWRELHVAAWAAARRAGEIVGRRAYLELRHGPFKPDPADGRAVQLHLVVDDTATLMAAPFLLRLQRAVTAELLVGTLPLPTPDGSPDQLAREAAVELDRWDLATAGSRIPYREWSFDAGPLLVDGWMPARTAWERECLRKAAFTARRLYGAAARGRHDP